MRAFDLVGKPRVIAVIFSDIGNLGAGFADDLAGIAGFKRSQSRRVFRNKIRQPHQQFATLARGHPGPFRRVKRVMRGVDGAVHIRAPGLGHQCPGTPCRRVQAFELGCAI